MYEDNGYYTEENANQNAGQNNNVSANTTGAYSGAQNINNTSGQQNYNYGSSGSSAYENNYGSTYNNNGTYNGSYEKKPEKKKGGLAVKAVTFAVCGALFGVCAGAGFYGINQLNKYLDGDKEVVVETNVPESVETSNTVTQLTKPTETQVITTDVTSVVESVMPAMVSIVNKGVSTSTFWGQTFTQEYESSGSGIIIAQDDTELLVVTNQHVIADATVLEVTFIDGSTAEAQVKGKDSSMDLAVIAIQLDSISSETKQAITIAKMGDSAALKLGEQVIAIGNALGYGQSVTGGWVSALNREITMEDGSVSSYIQTDAAINGGNSGGALLNMNGEVVGINSSKISGLGVEGMGYAIPMEAAEPIITELMAKETKTKVEDGNIGYMGIGLLAVPDDYVRYYNYPDGILVKSVESGSPAEAAGLLTYDIITEFDGEKTGDYETLQAALQYYRPGDTAKITVARLNNGQFEEIELEITLGERPAE